MPSKRRTVLNFSEKLKLIQSFDNSNGRKSVRELASEFGIGKTAAAEYLKRRKEIADMLEENVDEKRCRKKGNSVFDELDEVAWKWFFAAREKDVRISGPLIQEKALEFSSKLGIPNFKASNGWLERFKQRHYIKKFQKLTSAADASTSTRVPSATHVPTTTQVTTSSIVPKVEASSGSISISQEQSPIPVSQLSLAVVNSNTSFVQQQQTPGLPQITEISWGTAVPSLPPADTSWATESEYILPTTHDGSQPPTRDVSEAGQPITRSKSLVSQPLTKGKSVVNQPQTRARSLVSQLRTRDVSVLTQPRTRDIGVQVELITTQSNNVIHNKDWEDQTSGELRRTSSCTSSQYDRVSELDDSPSQCTGNKEPMEPLDISENSGKKKERVFLVFETMLLQLFTFCRLCFSGCSASVSSSCISVVVVQTRCGNGHMFKWESRPHTKSLGFLQLLQKEVNRLRRDLSEYHPLQKPSTTVKKRRNVEPEFIDVLELLALPKPLTRSSRARDDRYADS